MEMATAGYRLTLVGTIVFGLLAGCAGIEPRGPSIDVRQRILLTTLERDKILAEMRQMLGSASGVLHGLGTGDSGAAEKAARQSGMEAAVDVNPQLREKLPRHFVELGMQTHMKFDQLADQIKAGASKDDVLKSLASVTGNCVVCHARYRLEETR